MNVKIRNQIIGKIEKNDLAGARKLAEQWSKREPDEIMAWIMLADVHFASQDAAPMYHAIQAASQIDANHPMFHRTLSLGATLARAHTAAHGGAFCGFLSGLPAEILIDLRSRLKTSGACLDEEGQWLSPENTDPLWRALLPASWHRRSDAIDLVWAVHDEMIHINDRRFVPLIQQVRAGEKIQRDAIDPHCIRWLESLFGGLPKTTQIEPWMLYGPSTVYPTMILHLAGFMPETVDEGLVGTQTPHGVLISGVANPNACCALNDMRVVELLTRLSRRAFEGRITFEGPDPAFGSALGWMLS